MIKRTVPNELGDCDSYLGVEPICDICEQSIKEGQTVIQTFVGKVTKDIVADELGIVESLYNLVHAECQSFAYHGKTDENTH